MALTSLRELTDSDDDSRSGKDQLGRLHLAKAFGVVSKYLIPLNRSRIIFQTLLNPTQLRIVLGLISGALTLFSTSQRTLKRKFSDYEEHVLLLQHEGGLQLKRAELDRELQGLATLLSNHRRPSRSLSKAAKALMIKLGVIQADPDELSIEDLAERISAARVELKSHDEVLTELRRKRESLERKIIPALASSLEGNTHGSKGFDPKGPQVETTRAVLVGLGVNGRLESRRVKLSQV